MLTKAEVSLHNTDKVLSEVNRLRNLKYRDFPKDPPDKVLHDYLIVQEELQQHFLIPKEIVQNLITQEFIDQQKLALDIWTTLNIFESIWKSEGISNK